VSEFSFDILYFLNNIIKNDRVRSEYEKNYNGNYSHKAKKIKNDFKRRKHFTLVCRQIIMSLFIVLFNEETYYWPHGSINSSAEFSENYLLSHVIILFSWAYLCLVGHTEKRGSKVPQITMSIIIITISMHGSRLVVTKHTSHINNCSACCNPAWSQDFRFSWC
jgi:phosphate starvation-inducible membrane PsiE